MGRAMIRQALVALCLGAALSLGAPGISHAQNTTGSNGGFVSPSNNVKKVAPDAAAGSPGSLPDTSLDDRSGAGAKPATREGDVTNQVAHLAPVALFMFLVLAGCLYWFVFRKSTTPEGEAASKGTNTR